MAGIALNHAIAGLPALWAGRERFVVLDTAFADGARFLALWRAWRADPCACRQLVVVALSPSPPSPPSPSSDRAGPGRPDPLAVALQRAWPAWTPGLHLLDFDAGRVRLLLGVGPAEAMLRELAVRADWAWLDGIGLQRGTLKAVAHRMAPGASAALSGAAPGADQRLSAAGFRPLAAGHGLPPRWQPHTRPTPPAAQRQCHALVVGAGLAGAFCARGLADEGWSVRVLERSPAPATGASGNAAGLFHGTVHADDGVHARLFRAAALLAQRCIGDAVASGTVAGAVDGLLRLADDLAPMQSTLAAQGWPEAWVQALDAGAASARAGIRLRQPAWFYPGGGWVDPAALVAHALRGAEFQGRAEVQQLRHDGASWHALDAGGRLLASAPVLVWAAAQPLPALPQAAPAAWPLQRRRGQVSGWRRAPTPLRLPVAGGAYAIPLPDGLLCGATNEADDGAPAGAAVTAAAHALNHARLHAMTGLRPPPDTQRWFGRVGTRWLSADRLPVVGAVPAATSSPLSSLARAPRVPGLFVCTALGGRGITLAPLMGRLLAACIAGSPLPLEQRLADAVDPARWALRAARRGAGF